MNPMKKLMFSCLFLIAFSGVFSQGKHALMIGIGDYDTKITNWGRLNSVKDIEVMRTTLMRQKFLPRDIDTLLDKTATKANILAAMKKLINKV